MNSGNTISKIKMGIQSISINNSNLLSVYGFGSFFRSDTPNDCDLLLVVKDTSFGLGQLHAVLCQAFEELGAKLKIKFDLTILTEREHKRRPLREHDQLVELLTVQKKNP
ncbi:TPA: hypothetical protein RQN08_004106 [Aeromonas dhakensis]|nr:hypothetical protein [Aeromonas dhakensis]